MMSRIKQILRMYAGGAGKKQISVTTGVARNTVKKYLKRFVSLKITYADVDAMSDHEIDRLFTPQQQPPPTDERYVHLQQLLPDIEKQLKRKGVTRIQLWHDYIQKYAGGYARSQFNNYIQEYIGRHHPVMHIEHKAGDKLYIDFAGEKLYIVEKQTGELQETEVFVAILGCSQLTYAEAVRSQRKEDLISACENALRYFGGTTAAIVPDNLKSAVIKSSKYEPKLNEAFADFADHYSMAVLPTRAYRPKDKALVEGAVKLIYRSIYTTVSKDVFTSLQTLNTAIMGALEQHNNANFKGRDYSRRKQFEELEKPVLQQLPKYPYELRQQLVATVMKDGHVNLRLDKHYYSVPYRFIGEKVKLLFTGSRVEIFYRYECIAVHERSYAKYRYSTDTEHLASAHRYLSEWTPEKFIQKGAAIHEAVAMYISKVIEHKQHPEQAYKSCSGILNLVRKVGGERLTGACRRADSYGVYNFPIIVEILAKRLDMLDELNQPQREVMPEHNNIRGSEYYQ